VRATLELRRRIPKILGAGKRVHDLVIADFIATVTTFFFPSGEGQYG